MATPASNTSTHTDITTTTAAHTAAAGQAAVALPSATILLQAAKLAIQQDRAIMLDYFNETANGTAYLAEDAETKERVLAKSKEEFTSLIRKLYQVGDDFIVLTENSLYIVSGKIKKRKVNMASLQDSVDE